jgi:hypothetical protein
MEEHYIYCDVCHRKVAAVSSGLFRNVEVIRPFLEVPYYFKALGEWDLPVTEKGKKHICDACTKAIYTATGVGKGYKCFIKEEKKEG